MQCPNAHTLHWKPWTSKQWADILAIIDHGGHVLPSLVPVTSPPSCWPTLPPCTFARFACPAPPANFLCSPIWQSKHLAIPLPVSPALKKKNSMKSQWCFLASLKGSRSHPSCLLLGCVPSSNTCIDQAKTSINLSTVCLP